MDVDEERQQEVNSVLVKIGAVVLGIALVIGLGTLILVKGLGLDSDGIDHDNLLERPGHRAGHPPADHRAAGARAGGRDPIG